MSMIILIFPPKCLCMLPGLSKRRKYAKIVVVNRFALRLDSAQVFTMIGIGLFIQSANNRIHIEVRLYGRTFLCFSEPKVLPYPGLNFARVQFFFGVVRDAFRHVVCNLAVTLQIVTSLAT